MGKKKKSESLGRCLIKDKFSGRDLRTNSILHTSELNDGYEWGRLNLQSVTEESSFHEFLRTAELAGTEFQAERLNIAFVREQTGPGVLSKGERDDFEKSKKDTMHLMRIPRRPLWDSNTTTEELQANERESFLEWRRSLAQLQENQDIVLTPYEKNLDLWRQLWRVVERSDVVVQIVDARNPLLFRCEDLEKYTKEVCKDKLNFLLLNKADFLTDEQRKEWAKYFDSIGVKCAFASATKESEILEEIEEEKESAPDKTTEIDPENETTLNGNLTDKELLENEGVDSDLNEIKEEKTREIIGNEQEAVADKDLNSYQLLTRDELVDLFENLLPSSAIRITPGQTTIGLVGYPNVGKSSTINNLIGAKKVRVSATPGKTKHFQTLFLEGTSVMLCDCPGLVFPSQVATKADMLLCGILPIDQMRDYTQAVGTLRSFIPDYVIQSIYGIMIPEQPPGLHQHAPQTLLSSYAYCRGFMTANGCPDMSRAARLILKDFVNGKLLYCTAPPGINQEQFHTFPEPTKKPPQLTAIATRAIADRKMVTAKDLEGSFFTKAFVGSHSKGSSMAGVLLNQPGDSKSSSTQNLSTQQSKPWKDHSHKRNKKEKLRRMYRHLDE